MDKEFKQTEKNDTMRKNITLMAFAAGQESKENVFGKKYIGIGTVNVAAVCPTKVELESIFNTNVDTEPVYTGTDKNGVQYSRIDLLLNTVPENNNGIDIYSHMSLFLRNVPRYNRDKTKIQVIDKYGRTAWVTNEELKNHDVPTYSNGNKANLDSDYRPLFQGEEEVTEFFRTFLGIPNPMRYKNGTWVMVDNLSDCEARFDRISNTFKGDFSEFKTVAALQPNNKVKVMFGIRTADDGKQYQTHYTRMFLRNNSDRTETLEKHLQATRDGGGLSTSEFSTEPLHEYVVNATPLEEVRPETKSPFDSEDWF